MKFNKQSFIAWIREWKIGIILIANALFFLGFFYYDINSRGGIGDREIIGNLTYKFNQIERKFDREITWDRVDSNSVVTNFDSVRSDKNSVAVIQLKDGTEIEMDEESMVILELTAKTQKINFEKGSINVKKSFVEGESKGSITVESPKGKVKIKDGDVIVAKEKEDKLAVSVARGEAEVVIDGKTMQLKQNQVLTTQAGGELQAKQSPVRMESPVERTNRLERQLLASQKVFLNTPKESTQRQVIQEQASTKQVLTPSTTPSTIPTQPKPESKENSVTTTTQTQNPSPTPSKTSDVQQPTPQKVNNTPPKPKDSEEERRRKEQEALERFLKM